MENRVFKLDDEEIKFLKGKELNVEEFAFISREDVINNDGYSSRWTAIGHIEELHHDVDDRITENEEAIICLENLKKDLKDVDNCCYIDEEIEKRKKEKDISKKESDIFKRIFKKRENAIHEFIVDLKKDCIKNGKLKDVIYGYAIGDAMGVPYEFCKRDTFDCKDMVGNGTHNKPVGTWSDDTAMVLAGLDSLIQNNFEVNEYDIKKKYKEWANNGKYAIDNDVFDIGNTIYNAITLNDASDESLSNGALMRIVPLVFTDYNNRNGSSDTVIDKVVQITHKNYGISYVCKDYLDILTWLVYGKPLHYVLDNAYKYEYVYLKNNRDNIKSCGYIKDTFKAVIWSLVNSSNYKEAILNAVNLGGDTDTTAALTGALAGALYGYNNIPKEWIEKLRGKDIIDSIIASSINKC